MVEHFFVQYDGQQSADAPPMFRPGEVVRGQVVLNIEEPMKARKIKMEITGEASAKWTERKRKWKKMKGEMKTKTLHFQSSETYINETLLLWSEPDNQIESGHHVYSFNFVIPPHSPPSYEGAHGKIRYQCFVEIDRPWKFDKSITSNFIVAPVLDLNTVAWIQNPQEHPISKSVGMLCCKSGNLLADVCLPKSGFVAGERIPIMINIKNNTSREVTKVRAALVEKAVYTASQSKKDGLKKQLVKEIFALEKHAKQGNTEARNELVKLNESVKIAKGSEEKFEGELLVPPCVTSFNNCPIIRVEHLLEVKINVHGCCCDTVATGSLPVVIGTIGLTMSSNLKTDGTIGPNSNMKPESE